MSHWIKQVEDVIAGRRQHALIHGDCLDVGRKLPEEGFDSCAIDPPYGMDYQGWEGKRAGIANDKAPFIWWMHDAYRLLKPTAGLVCFCNWKNQEAFKFGIETARFNVRSQVVWDRMSGGMGHTGMTFMPKHDIVWFATKGRFRFPNGRPPSLMSVPNVPTQQRLHSTQKPHELMVRLIRAITPAGGVVFDPTMGSGSTGEAAIRAGYRFVGIELDDHNYQVARDRIRKAKPDSSQNTKPCLARPVHAHLARHPHYHISPQPIRETSLCH